MPKQRNSRKSRGPARLLFAKICLVYAFFSLSALGAGCASFSRVSGENVLAYVNGEPIVEGDLVYALEIAHRKEKLAGGGTLDISEYVQQLIDDRLIIQESRRMGLDADPVVRNKVEQFELREAVLKLHQVEVMDKIRVSDEDVLSFYNDNLQQYNLAIIKTKTEESAQEALEKVNGGAEFVDMVKEYSTIYRETEEAGDPQETMVISKRALLQTPRLAEAIFALEPGQTTGVVKEEKEGSFYIVKYLGNEEPAAENLEHIRKRLEGDVRAQKKQEREDAYVAELREKSDLDVDRELLAEVLADGSATGEGDDRTVARVFGDRLTASDLAEALKSLKPGTSGEEAVENWINTRVINHEALLRNYHQEPAVKVKSDRFLAQLLKNAFFQNAVFQKISVTDQNVREYYRENRDRFAKGDRFKVLQITVKEEALAEKVMQDLQKGVDFAWLAREHSIDHGRVRSGSMGWQPREFFPKEVGAVLDRLEPGGLSPVIMTAGGYMIVRLEDKEKGEVPAFEQVKSDATEIYFRSQVQQIRDDYVSKLREDAAITINEGAVRSVQKGLMKK